jgi:CDGSH-type Zn-finger protein
MADATLKVNDNGPILVRGTFTLVDAEGNEYETKDTIALCRCGQSSNKPFCDGTHGKVGFESVCRRQEA